VAKLCGRPGCSDPGTVAYGMVPEDLLFWVAALDGDVDRDTAVLCRRHADAMVVPRGWTLDDRREATPRLFRPNERRGERTRNGVDDTGSSRRPRRRRRAPGAPQLELEVAALDEVASLDDVASPDDQDDGPADMGVRGADATDDTPIAPWRPSFDTDDSLGGLLEADSPLLARAFRGTDRPRG
jgi:hypothetical protein